MFNKIIKKLNIENKIRFLHRKNIFIYNKMKKTYGNV